MSTVDEIRQAIEQLPSGDFWELSKWVVGQRNEEWDRQLDGDAASGRLEFLVAEAEAAAKADLGPRGRSLPRSGPLQRRHRRVGVDWVA
jgi:hypothetical protein